MAHHQIGNLMNKFDKLKGYINSVSNGSLITRKELSINLDFKRDGQSTYDLYRVRLCRMGYLDHVGLGVYKKIKDIPEDMRVKDTLSCYMNQRTKLKDYGKTKKSA